VNDYLEKKLQPNSDDTISFGKSVIDHASGIDIGKKRADVKKKNEEARK
jgi:hypothetical protein